MGEMGSVGDAVLISDNLVAILVPLGVFASIAFIIYARYYFLSKISLDQQETLRQAVAAGQKLDEEIVSVLAKRPPSPESDLKSGIMLLAFGIGFNIAGMVARFISFDQDMTSILHVIGTIMAFGGVGSLISFRLRTKLQKHDEKNKVGE